MSERRHVLVRTYSAGVHVGELVGQDGKLVKLAYARRIWSWVGANSLNEIANHGCAVGSRVSEAVEENFLTEAIEILIMSPEAIAKIATLAWGK